MQHRIACPKCKKIFEVPASAAGRVVQCAACGQQFRVPTFAAEPRPQPRPAAQPPASEEDWDALLASPPEPETPSESPPERFHRPARNVRIQWGPILLKLVPLGVLGVLLMICSGIIWHWVADFQEALDSAPGDDIEIADLPTEPFEWPTEAEFPIPRLDHPIAVDGEAQHITVRLPVEDGRAGFESEIHVFTPPIKAKPKSLPCVFVPATLGAGFGDKISSSDSWRKAYTTIAEEGRLVVVTYDTDGVYPDVDSIAIWNQPARIRRAFKQHIASRGGMVNARNAVEFALDNIEAIDPDRLAAGKFSLTGHTAILHGLLDDRIKRTYAAEPICDAVEWAQERTRIDVALGDELFARMRLVSPMTYADRVDRPIEIWFYPLSADFDEHHYLLDSSREFATAAGPNVQVTESKFQYTIDPICDFAERLRNGE